MREIRFQNGAPMALEMHKARVVQKLRLLSTEERFKAITEAGFNTFLLHSEDVFLDMLTDSGSNAMSDSQVGAMMQADDAYAGSQSFFRLEAKVRELFGHRFFLPAHQGRACENILMKTFVREGSVVPMNYHFTTTKAHITLNGGRVEELVRKEGLEVTSDEPFKGNFDLERLEQLIQNVGTENIPFIRVEAGTNLIGGQPISLTNMIALRAIADRYHLKLLLDASLLQDNLYFIKKREPEFATVSIRDLTLKIASLFELIYFSARKLGFARGGGIMCRDRSDYDKMKDLVPLYEGFMTYGGMSVREIEAIAVGLEETMDEEVINQGPLFIQYMVDELHRRGIPVVTPAGGLGCHLDARSFLPHVPQTAYPAGALASALFLVSGVRGMERGTLSEQREPDGSEHLASMELVRLALPRRVFTKSHIDYAVDRIDWLFRHREIISGLRFVEEPATLRFFLGRLESIGEWPRILSEKFREDFGE
jgi:tryptophanase